MTFVVDKGVQGQFFPLVTHPHLHIYLLCSDVVNYFLSSKYCILLTGVYMLLFITLQ